MKKTAVLLTFLVSFHHAFCQSSQTDTLEVIKSDADIRSGNFRDVLTDFFQLALTDLSGKEKSFRFSSNLFALRLKVNPDLNIDSLYKSQSFWRNSNLDFDLKMDEKYRFNGASLGYRYALINKRDFSVAKDFSLLLAHKLNRSKIFFNAVQQALSERYGHDITKLQEMNNEINGFLNDPNIKFRSLSPEAQDLITALPLNADSISEDFSFAQNVRDIYEEVVDSYKNKLLWTIGSDASTFSNGEVSEINLSTRATSGFMKIGRRSNLEFDIKAQYSLLDDSLSAGRDLNRHIISAEGGLNCVFRDRNNDKSIFEIKISSAYNKRSKVIYSNEKDEFFSLNGTLRFRLNNEISLPIDVKYDPDRGKLFGYLGVKFNFDWFEL